MTTEENDEIFQDASDITCIQNAGLLLGRVNLKNANILQTEFDTVNLLLTKWRINLFKKDNQEKTEESWEDQEGDVNVSRPAVESIHD